MKRWFLIVRLLALWHWIEWSRPKAFGSWTPVFLDIRNIDLMGFDFFQLSLYNSMIPITFSWWSSFFLWLSLGVSISEMELHVQLLRCWPRVPLLLLPAALLCVQEQSQWESVSSAGFSLPATGPNSQGKIVQNAVLPPCSSPYTTFSSMGFFILTLSLFSLYSFSSKVPKFNEYMKSSSSLNISLKKCLLWCHEKSHTGTAGVLW